MPQNTGRPIPGSQSQRQRRELAGTIFSVPIAILDVVHRLHRRVPCNVATQHTILRDADPQARQVLFSAVVGALGIGLAKAPRTVTLTLRPNARGCMNLRW